MKKRRNKKTKIVEYGPEEHPLNSIFIILTILFIIGFFMLQLSLEFTGFVVFEPVSNFSLNEDFGNLELNLSDNVTDESEPDSLINYTVTLTDNSIVTAVFDLMNGTGNLTFYSVADKTGSTSINITAYNTTDAQNSTFFTLRIEEVNDAPSTPVLHLPLNDTFNSTLEFDWSNSTDVENNETNYTIEISDNITFPYTNFTNSTIIETENTTKEVSVSTLEDAEYYWRVLATDSVDNSSFSEVRTFMLDTIPPTEFNLTSPDNETNSTDNTPALAWQETIEINFDNYTIEFSNQSDFEVINFSFSNVGTVSNNSFSNWNSTEILSNGTWYWKVTAYDKAGNFNQTNPFVYIIGKTENITTERRVTQETGKGQTRGPRQLQQVALDIIQPSPLSLFTNDTIITPIFITNKGDTTLRNINLDAITNISYLDLQLAQETIEILFPGQAIAIDLIIRSTPETLLGQHEVLIEANVLEPDFKDSAKFFINLLEFGFGERKIVREKIEVTNKLFNANPDCLELRNLIEKAEAELEKQNYNKALALVEVAIQACKDLVASLGKELVIEPRKRDYYIAIIETLATLILFALIYRYYKKKRILKKLKKK